MGFFNGSWKQTIGELLNLVIRKTEEGDIVNDSVTVVKNVATTLLPANDNRTAVSFSNLGSKSVMIRFKAAVTDNNIDGILLEKGSRILLSPLTYKGEISSIRETTGGGQVSEVVVMEW